MPKFIVSYYDSVCYSFVVEAESAEEAQAKTSAQYDNAKYTDADSVEYSDTTVTEVE